MRSKIGISKDVNWNGGGSFKYYHLGPSIIDVGAEGHGDFNWSLGREFIEESLLGSYDFTIDNSVELKGGKLFDNTSKSAIGFVTRDNKLYAGVVSLASPEENDRQLMSQEEVFTIFNSIKNEYQINTMILFTNRGIELSEEDKPQNLDIVKVPQDIFADLEK